MRQELALEFERPSADFIGEKSASVGQFETTHAIFDRAGESATDVAEKFAFEEFTWN